MTTPTWTQTAAVRLATLLGRYRFVRPDEIPPHDRDTIQLLVDALRRCPVEVKM